MKTEYFCRAIIGGCSAYSCGVVALAKRRHGGFVLTADGGVESGGDRTDGGRRVPWTLTLSSELYVGICRIILKTKRREDDHACCYLLSCL